jgi:hypothetical protein
MHRANIFQVEIIKNMSLSNCMAQSELSGFDSVIPIPPAIPRIKRMTFVLLTNESAAAKESSTSQG